MILPEPMALTLLAESLVALVGVAGAWLFFTLRGQQQDKNAAHGMIQRIQQNEPARITQIQESFSLKKGEASNEISQVLAEERQFYKKFLQIYLDRDPKVLASLPDQITSLLRSHARLCPAHSHVTPSAPPTLTAQKFVPPTSNAELESLRKEHDRLKTYLNTLLETLLRMMGEYASHTKNESILEETTVDQLLQALLILQSGGMPLPPESSYEHEEVREEPPVEEIQEELEEPVYVEPVREEPAPEEEPVEEPPEEPAEEIVEEEPEEEEEEEDSQEQFSITRSWIMEITPPENEEDKKKG
ncbi:hypothetical protein CCP3SC1AL1_2140003 [Gammaproteobacteria bacterium]